MALYGRGLLPANHEDDADVREARLEVKEKYRVLSCIGQISVTFFAAAAEIPYKDTNSIRFRRSASLAFDTRSAGSAEGMRATRRGRGRQSTTGRTLHGCPEGTEAWLCCGKEEDDTLGGVLWAHTTERGGKSEEKVKREKEESSSEVAE
ncbi:hypothetical protein DL770_009001 [Monosporascus sp. CRB-9-2]|nr:hypothetical protein DL770_009001 [Monosporascus sp. CRB-9-2]